MTKTKSNLSKPLTLGALEKSAAFYLERFSTSAENLRRVLRRKLLRAEPEARPALAVHIDAMIERYAASGLLNDEAYAEGRIASLRRQGASTRGIARKLSEKGVERDTIAAKLDEADGDDAQAAWAFARRRRLGPYRPAETREAMRQKDMAAFGRAGFSYQVAREVVEAETIMEGDLS